MSRFEKVASDDVVGEKEKADIHQLAKEWGGIHSQMKKRARQMKEKRQQHKDTPKKLMDGGLWSHDYDKDAKPFIKNVSKTCK